MQSNPEHNTTQHNTTQHNTTQELFEPVKVFIALILASLFIFTPITQPAEEETPKMLRPFASSAEACPWNCIKCTAWDPNAWPKTCLTYECVDAGGNCGEDDGGGGGPSYQAPTISHVLTCSNTGSNPSTGSGTGWCIGALSLDLTASDPQGQSVIISGDVNGNTFACPNGQTTCSVPLLEGTGTATYKVDSATGLSASGSTTYQLDVTTPQISGSINGSIGQNGWYVTQTVISAAASDTFSGIASFEVNVDNTGWVPYNDTAFSDGSHTIQFRAYDNAGNLTETPVQPVLVDTLPPTLNAPGSLRLVDALNYQLADATSGLSQLTISIADKDHLQPDVVSNFAVTGNAQDGSFSWDGMFPTSHANAGWYPFTLTVTDMAGHQTSLSGAYEVKWRYLVALGLAPDKSEQKQSASRIYAPGFASVPSSNTEAPAETVLPTESSVEEEIQSASPPPVAISQKPFQGMSVQASFSAGNQSNASQSTNLPASNILWGAAAAAVLGATLAEWQKKREEEAARLAALIASNAGQGDDDEIPPDVLAKRRGKVIAKNQAKRAQEQAWEAARIQQQAKIAKVVQADMTQEEKLSAYKQTAGYIARQESNAEYERQKAMEAQRAGEWNAVAIVEEYKAQEQEKQNAGGGKPLAVLVPQEPNPLEYEDCKPFDLACHVRNVKTWWNSLGTESPQLQPAATPTPTLVPMTQTPTKTLHPDVATIIAYETANTPLPTWTPLPRPTSTYLDSQLQAYGIDTRAVDGNLLPIILKATQLTANKFQPFTGGTPQQTFIMSHGTIAIVINKDAQIDNGNCETERVTPGTQYWIYGQNEPTYDVQTTITCKEPPSLANLIHEFVHAFDLNYRVFGSPSQNLFSDNLKDLIVGDQYLRTINVEGEVIRDPRGFTALGKSLENSWTPSLTEEFADIQMNAILDGSGVDSVHGFKNDEYGNARRDEWNALMNQWQQDMQAHFDSFLK